MSKCKVGGILLQLLLLASLAGCSHGVSRPLPTLVPLAAVPAMRRRASLPSTYTPVPVPLPFPTRTSGPKPVEQATVTPTIRHESLPTAVPADVGASSALASYRTEPPATVDCAAGLLLRSRFTSAVGGPWRYYHAYLPPCYGQDGRQYPVLYLFHGSIQTDTHWLELGLKQLADEGIKAGRYPSFIAILPYNGQIGNMTSGGSHSIEAITVQNLVPFVELAYCAWPDRAGRSLGGISRGGYWALMIAFRQPDLFGSVSGHSSHLRFETDAPEYNPLATYALADLANMRIWLDWGENDFLRTGQEQLHASLTRAGIAHVAIVNSGGHSDTYWAAHLREYIDWHAAAWPKERQFYPACAGSG